MDSSETAHAAPAADVAHVRTLIRQRRFAEALEIGRTLLSRAPDERDALLYVAIAERNLGRISEALATLGFLEQRFPRFSRVHQERGLCFVALKQAGHAIDAFSLAVNLNYALPASWSMLEGLYGVLGQADSRAWAADQVASLRKLPPDVVNATALFMDGDIDAAETMIRSFLLAHGSDVEAMRLLARIGMARKVFDDAELLLDALLKLAPDYTAARAEYAETLIELHKYAAARRELDRLEAEDPGRRPYYQSLQAAAAVGLGEHERAIALYRTLLAANPGDADTHLSIAHALKTMGERDAAIASYREAAAHRKGFGDAYWSLANLKTYRFTAEELREMQSLKDAPGLTDMDRYHLYFALGKALEDRAQFAEAFRSYERGNDLKRAVSNYSPQIIENNTRQQIDVCTREFFAKRSGVGSRANDPIFIVGLPRSGSTLLEQILASHSQVEGTQELPDIQQIVGNLRGRDPDPANPRYPRILTELSFEEFAHLGEQYLNSTRVYRSADPPIAHFIDKMPNNFRHLGLIRLMLPNAKIIDARREPVACCFSNLKQLFAKGQEFTYSVEDIARYYRTYLELMRHWDTVLPGWVLRVHHEDVVDDLEGNVRRLLEFCGLPFEPQCLEFYKTVRNVRTASSEQVRQPIFRDGLDQWKHFEPWLQPLQNALGDALARYRDV